MQENIDQHFFLLISVILVYNSILSILSLQTNSYVLSKTLSKFNTVSVLGWHQSSTELARNS